MNQRYHNPFSASRLEYPTEQREHYLHHVQRSSSLPVDESPFPRMIDFWWASLSLAVRNGLEPIDLSNAKTTRFVEGSVFDSDPWRIQFLRLIALHVKSQPEIVGNPSEIISMANGLAAAGVPGIVEMLADGDEPPIWNISNAVEQLISEANCRRIGSE